MVRLRFRNIFKNNILNYIYIFNTNNFFLFPSNSQIDRSLLKIEVSEDTFYLLCICSNSSLLSF